MAPTRKTERILNLTICLLVSDRYLPKSRIREAVEGYHDLSDAAFERTFERDKDELRALGRADRGRQLRRVLRRRAGLPDPAPASSSCPPIDLDAEEASVVGVAARVWQHASMAESTMSALAKLRAAGVEPDTSQLAALEPSVQATEPAFEPLWTAVLERARVSFTYRDGDKRTLEPWGLTASKGRWYVIGRDVDRAGHPDVQAVPDRRPAPAGCPGPARTRCPADLDLRALARSLAPREPTETALLAIRAGRAPALAPARRAGERPSVPLPGGFEVFAVAYGDLWHARRGDRPARAPTWWCWSRSSCGAVWSCCAG